MEYPGHERAIYWVEVTKRGYPGQSSLRLISKQAYFFQLHRTTQTLTPASMNVCTQTLPLLASSKTKPTNPRD